MNNYILPILLLFSTVIVYGQNLENAIDISAKDANNPPDNIINLDYFTVEDYGSSESLINNWNLYFTWDKSDLSCNEQGIVSASVLPPFNGVSLIASSTIVELQGGQQCAQSVAIPSSAWEHLIEQNTVVDWGQIEVNSSLDVSDLEITKDSIIAIDGTYLGESNIALFSGSGELVSAAIGDIDQGPLPIELLSFTASPDERTVQLDWKSAQEVNASHFIVQRSVEGYKWQPIGKVQATGNTTETQSYKFTDKKPYAGHSYYRLKKIDIDGFYEFSAVRRVHIDIPQVSYSVSPNPFTDIVNIEIKGKELQNHTTSVKLFSTAGRMVKEVNLQETTNTITLNCTDLRASTYILKLFSGSTLLYSQKIIKQ